MTASYTTHLLWAIVVLIVWMLPLLSSSRPEPQCRCPTGVSTPKAAPSSPRAAPRAAACDPDVEDCEDEADDGASGDGGVGLPPATVTNPRGQSGGEPRSTIPLEEGGPIEIAGPEGGTMRIPKGDFAAPPPAAETIGSLIADAAADLERVLMPATVRALRADLERPWADAADAHRRTTGAFNALRRFILAVRLGVYRRDLTAANPTLGDRAKEDRGSKSSSSNKPTGAIAAFRPTFNYDVDAVPVPVVPLDLPRLRAVVPVSMGLVAGFEHPVPSDAATHAAGGRSGGGLRVAVLTAGQMRTYAGCAARLRERVVEASEGLLFVATVPQLGNRKSNRYSAEAGGSVATSAVPEVETVDLHDVVRLYGPRLAAMMLVDSAAAREHAVTAMGSVMYFAHIQWMVAQFSLIDAGAKLIDAYAGGWRFDESTIGPMALREKQAASHRATSNPPTPASAAGKQGEEDEVVVEDEMVNPPEDALPAGGVASQFEGAAWIWWRGLLTAPDATMGNGRVPVLTRRGGGADDGYMRKQAVAWGGFDVVVRVRPDLFIVGTVRLTSPPPGAPLTPQGKPPIAVLHFECGGEPNTARAASGPAASYITTREIPFDADTFLATPHHPTHEWQQEDRTSDLTLIAAYRRAMPLTHILSYLARRWPSESERSKAIYRTTAEMLWVRLITQEERATLLHTLGWVGLLRQTELTWTNSEQAKGHWSPEVWRVIFGTSNASAFSCPTDIPLAREPSTHKKKKRRR